MPKPKPTEIPADLNLSMGQDEAQAELEAMQAEHGAIMADKAAKEEEARKRDDKAFVYAMPEFDDYRFWALHYLAAGEAVPKRNFARPVA